MRCSVNNVTFGAESKKAIAEIRAATRSANWLSIALGASILSDIFVRNGPVSAMYKIQTTDFELLGSAMQSSTPILKRKVSHLVGALVLFQGTNLTAGEKQFWRCIYNEVK